MILPLTLICALLAAPTAPGAPGAPRAPGAPGAVTLRFAVEQALARNERGLIAGARADAAGARLEKARSFFWPDLTLSGVYSHQLFEADSSGSTNALVRQFGGGREQSQDTLEARANLSATLFDFKAYPLLRQARRLRDAAALDAREARRLLAFEAASAYLSTRGALLVLRTSELREHVALTTMADAKARLDARLSSAHDLTRAELEVGTARSSLAVAKSGFDQSVIAFAALIDADPESLVFADAWPEGEGVVVPNSGVSSADVSAARARRLDLAARRELVAAQSELSTEPMRRFVPTLRGDLSYRLSSEENFSGRNDDGAFTLTLAWPLFDGFERNADQSERLATLRELSLAATQQVRLVERDVSMALARSSGQAEVLKQAASTETLAERNFKETETLHREGLATAFELADATHRRFEAALARVRAEIDAAAASLQYNSALGLDPGGLDWSEP